MRCTRRGGWMGLGMGTQRDTINIDSLQVLHFPSSLTNSSGQTQFLVLRVVVLQYFYYNALFPCSTSSPSLFCYHFVIYNSSCDRCYGYSFVYEPNSIEPSHLSSHISLLRLLHVLINVVQINKHITDHGFIFFKRGNDHGSNKQIYYQSAVIVMIFHRKNSHFYRFIYSLDN